jgi:hypothetical protein
MSSYLTTSAAASTYQTLSGMSSYLTTSAAASTYLTQSNAASTYFTIASADGKANLSGATFTGKVNFTPVSGVAGLNVGIGGTSAAATTAGDLWISSGGVNLNYRDGTGAWRIVAITTSTNTFSSPQIIDTTSTTTALRVTQKGTGDAIRVEDDTTPDASRFTVDQFGKVGIGIAPDATAALKVDTNGIMFGDDTVQTTAASPFTGDLDGGTLTNCNITPGADKVITLGAGGGIYFPDSTVQISAGIGEAPFHAEGANMYLRQNGNWSGPYNLTPLTIDGTTYYIPTLANP